MAENNNNNLSKGAQLIASSGAPLKEAHGNKKRDKEGNEIRLEELAAFSPEAFLESHKSVLRKFHIASLILMIVCAVLFVFAVALSITFTILAEAEKKRMEEMRLLKPGEWKIDCQRCFELKEDFITLNMTRSSAGKDSKEMETAQCQYSILDFRKCYDMNASNDSVCFK